MADEEPVDPKRELEDRCKAPCTRPLKEYQACSKRIQGTNTVRDSTLITGAVLTIALLLSYFRILNNQ